MPRQTCQYKHPPGGPDQRVGELCGKPAVDFVETKTTRGTEVRWLCAEHFDLRKQAEQILANMFREVRDRRER